MIALDTTQLDTRLDSPLEKKCPALVISNDSGQPKTFPLENAETCIGRTSHANLEIDDPLVSRRHAIVTVSGGRVTLLDLGSRNGTIVNGRRITNAAIVLNHGDTIQIVDTVMRFVEPGPNSHCQDDPESGPVERDAGEETMMTATLQESPSPFTLSSRIRQASRRAADPRLVLQLDGMTRELPIREQQLLIGRCDSAQIRLGDENVSWQHARVAAANGRFFVEDLNSRNGVRVNGMRVQRHQLAAGDLIRIGNTTMRFLDRHGSQEVVRSAVSARRPVVLIPGLCGSELWNGQHRIWPNSRRLLLSSENRFQRDWANLRVGGLVRLRSKIPGLPETQSFGALVSFLKDELGYESGQDLLEFSYDWRQDNYDTAGQLAEAIEQWRATRQRPTEPVTLVAHSMGGIVSRLYLNAWHGSDAVERCVFMGTPHFGSLKSLRLVIGGSGVLPFGLSMARLRRLVMQFPSIYQLFPGWPGAQLDDGRPFMPLESDPDWLPARYHPHLERAAKVRRLLDASNSDSTIPKTCIVGYGKKTLHQMVVRRHASGQLSVASLNHLDTGDGTVPERSAVLDHAEVHPVKQNHGALHADRDVMRQLRLELVERPRGLAANATNTGSRQSARCA